MNLTQIAVIAGFALAAGLLTGRYLLPSGRHVMFGHGYTEHHRWLGDCGMKPAVALDAAWQDGITDLVRGRRDAMRLAAKVRQHDQEKNSRRGDVQGRDVQPPGVLALAGGASRSDALPVSPTTPNGAGQHPRVSPAPPVVPGPAERDAVSGASGPYLPGRPPAGPGTTCDLDHPAPHRVYPELAALADVPRPGIEAAQPNASAAAVDHARPGHAAPPDELAEELADEAETFLRALRESPEEWHLRLEDEHREWCVRNGLEWQPLDFAPSPAAALEPA